MSAILIKNAPPQIHDWLKQSAAKNRRSMTQQAVWCFEWCMENMSGHADFPAPVRLKGGRLTMDEIDIAKKAGRK